MQTNNSNKGNILITNLRLIWFDQEIHNINLSIGYFCIKNIKFEEILPPILKNIQKFLCIIAKYNQSEFEFKFKYENLRERICKSLENVLKSYNSTEIYRELRLRANIIQDKQLILLKNEEIFSNYPNVWNLSSSSSNIGSIFVTNIRIVWFSTLAENFNISLPWIQISTIKAMQSKYGTALVIETSSNNAGYIIGFKVELINLLYPEITNLFKVNNKKPILGIQTEGLFPQGKDDPYYLELEEVYIYIYINIIV